MCLAIPAKIVELFPDELFPNAGRALVEVGGVRRQINTGLLQDDPPKTGDWVLIHVGFAMSKISESDAEEQMQRHSRCLGSNKQPWNKYRVTA
jgi:hydrogenase expression/formation protein HypC